MGQDFIKLQMSGWCSLCKCHQNWCCF